MRLQEHRKLRIPEGSAPQFQSDAGPATGGVRLRAGRSDGGDLAGHVQLGGLPGLSGLPLLGLTPGGQSR